ncbi:MAG: DUF3365 domain-containing protein [Nitrospirales bacterium]|nr:DUF3365 domain-containing protein [Nitrospirales bacterium]
MTKTLVCCGVLLVLMIHGGGTGWGNEAVPQLEEPLLSEVGFSPEVVANYIHAVIAADRALYTTHVVERMNQERIVIAAEAWKQRKTLPLPAQMLLMAGRMVEMGGTGLRYRLASLWPIYEENGPASVFEETGLQVVAEDPSEIYSGIIKRGNKKFFKAIYPDFAVSKECVNCHNGHILSSKRDYKLGDVMGGIIISFPLPLEENE